MAGWFRWCSVLFIPSMNTMAGWIRWLIVLSLNVSKKGVTRKRVDPLEGCFNIDMTFFKPSTYKHRLPTIE
jgi:hypothetical protein